MRNGPSQPVVLDMRLLELVVHQFDEEL